MTAPDGQFDAAAILRALTEKRVDFVVVGGIAVQAHGYLRGTGDLDVIPDDSLLNLSRLGEALVELDAELWRAAARVDVTDPRMLKRSPQLPLITRHGRLDLLNLEHTAGAPRSFVELRSRALVLEVEDIEIAVAGLDDLLRMKRAAGRDQDRLDIAALTRTDDELEAEAGRST